MDRRAAPGKLPWVTAAAVLVMGIAMRDCVLSAMSVVFGFHAFYADIESCAPWQGWRLALRCWLMSLFGLIAALALAVMVIGALLGWWTPANDQPQQALMVLVLALAACWIAQGRIPEFEYSTLVLPAAVTMAAIALMAKANDLALAPCIFAMLTSIGVAAAAWRLARHTGRELAMSDGSRY